MASEIIRTTTEIRADLTFWLNSKTNWQNAMDALAKGGQSFEMRDGDTTRVLTRVDLPKIIKTIQTAEAKIASLRAELAAATGTGKKPSRVACFRGA